MSEIFIGRILSKKKYECTGSISEKMDRAEAATSSYFETCNFLQYICPILVAKNCQKIQSRCIVHEFFFTDIFNNINHGYRAAIMMKNSLWLLPFYMAVVCYSYYGKMSRTMRTAVVTFLLK